MSDDKVFFPEPLAPTTAVISPLVKQRFRSSNTAGRLPYLKVTPLKQTGPAISPVSSIFCPVSSGSRSMTSNNRFAAISASCTVMFILIRQIGSAHVCTPVTNEHLVCHLLLENKKHIY